jgi:ferredoxin
VVNAGNDTGRQPDEAPALRVTADTSACCAYALCVEICPQVFHLGADNVVELLHEAVPASLVEPVRRAVSECPQSALSLTTV